MKKNHPLRIAIELSFGFYLLFFQIDFIGRGIWLKAISLGKPPIYGIIMLIGGIILVANGCLKLYRYENEKTRDVLTYLFPVYIGLAALFYFGFYRF